MPRKLSTTLTQLGTGSRIRSYPAKSPLDASGATKTTRVVSPALLALSERQFQAIVVAELRRRSWICWSVPNMRQTSAGLPDLFCVHPDHALILLWEIKAERTRVTPLQTKVIEILERIPGVDARIMRPSGWEAIRDGLLETLP